MYGDIQEGGLYMLTIIRNDWYRMKEQKLYLFVALGLTICAVVFAVVLTKKLEPKMNLAVVESSGKGGSTQEGTGAGYLGEISGNKSLDITILKKEPSLSQLIQGRYDAVLTFGKDGKRQITTVKSAEFQEQLEAVLDGKHAAPYQEGRRIGTNIIGYMLMFLLMQGVLYARLFTEDKEKHQMERIVCSPVPFWKYLSGHVVFMWGLITIPAMLVIVVMKILGVSVGFALWQYLLMIGLTALVSTSFAVCLNSFFCVADTANMAGSCAVVLTSVLSGSFYDMGNAGGILSGVLYILPQKNLMVFLDAWEKQDLNRSAVLGLFYVILCTVVFLSIGIIKTRKDYIYHRSISDGKK